MTGVLGKKDANYTICVAFLRKELKEGVGKSEDLKLK